MIETLIRATLIILALLGGWLAIQSLWRRVFERPNHEDPLSGRLGCHGCRCHPSRFELLKPKQTATAALLTPLLLIMQMPEVLLLLHWNDKLPN